uniref:LIM and SH3 protein n=1 Tax=Ciona intestinalis TaxID=7719 RepID=Q589R6_CIOIN|nr:LIM and SH3 protein [Ciona intestinalis]XP_009862105.1 LIM and SH3 protein isoform X1 [Ciona intestinalis]XP_026692734.1 LIM and SH3 protein isoform X1 [Ciona intestinalis]BAD93250.1 lasp [Ciona intestinalis]|eukprot:NP_001029010.1 LIM and SH3 protein [Ciona intestinalis]
MNPPCARCKKTVYPTEKLSCLDKTWHKSCFTCETCNLKLTMKTYKGYNKLPYCNTHYPTTRFTAVSDTPENKRLAQQQKNQSEVVYRKDKMNALKDFTQVAETVSSRTATQASKLASNISYQTAPHEVGRDGPVPVENIVNRRAPPGSAPAYSAPQPQPPAPVVAQPPPPVQAKSPTTTPKYVAIYDYAAADDDEVSIQEGDKLIDVTVIDEGWMEGRNARTGAYGMFPSNYVQKV